MWRRRRGKNCPMFMIIPMIDVIFFLLVFFMMNSLQTVIQKALSVQLPAAQSEAAPIRMPILITVDQDGHVLMDNVPVSVAEMETQLELRLAEREEDAAVILQADTRTAHGQVVAVMDRLKAAGVKRLAIAAKQKEP